MSIISSTINSFLTSTMNETIDTVKKYVNGEQNMSILIDAQPIDYTPDCVVYSQNMIELLRIRTEEKQFSIASQPTESATPKGDRIVKGVSIGNHDIIVRNGMIAKKMTDLYQDFHQQLQYLLNKATVYCKMVNISPPDKIIDTTKSMFSNIYQTASQINDIITEADSVISFVKNSHENKAQKFQTLLENLFLKKENCTYKVTYCGKLYNNMLLQNFSTIDRYEGELTGINIHFHYSSTTNTNINPINASVKGLNIKTNDTITEIQGNYVDNNSLLYTLSKLKFNQLNS